ncbi:hypothetical protein Rleg9DRAFT_1702 [Rhizobium leguminosarum bv. trifolii WSM597]|uniref:Uncharacterized protein n=1 Tax=Rhizobium leguminosarum bv. trifolii WSM597 TaxID=754764 RepID=J0GZ74_RHILT|nr:hypothetical protein [Rhizobium leguminosarum]EJB02888.1 hypothetical protein Rleg9DRAFT_1702 [Rhizobium leguminosarum bv. trifolii WSM597]
MKGVVKKNFPFALDGINITQIGAGTDFPPAGYSVQDKTFEGLAAAGFIEATEESALPADEELNRRIIDALDKKLSAMSDEELKAVIARRGTPFSGNMVHAVLVGEAKSQMLAELEGHAPVTMVDPNSGITEQPLSAPGQATPPSAAAAVAQQQAAADAAAQQQNEANQNDANQGGKNEVTNQFDEKLPDASKSDWKSEAELNTMNKADLETYAAEKKVDLTGLKTKPEYVEALKPKTAE